MKTALSELDMGDPSLLLEAVRHCLLDAKKPLIFRLFSGKSREDDIMAGLELAEHVAKAWRAKTVSLRPAEIYTLLRAYMKALKCMQENSELALDVPQRAKMAGKLLHEFTSYAIASKNPYAEHLTLRMKGKVVQLDSHGIHCVDESTVSAFAEEIYRFWDAHRGHANGDMCRLAEELDRYLAGNSRAIMHAKRRPADKP